MVNVSSSSGADIFCHALRHTSQPFRKCSERPKPRTAFETGIPNAPRLFLGKGQHRAPTCLCRRHLWSDCDPGAGGDEWKDRPEVIGFKDGRHFRVASPACDEHVITEAMTSLLRGSRRFRRRALSVLTAQGAQRVSTQPTSPISESAARALVERYPPVRQP
jgi:hypothetical protein